MSRQWPNDQQHSSGFYVPDSRDPGIDVDLISIRRESVGHRSEGFFYLGVIGNHDVLCFVDKMCVFCIPTVVQVFKCFAFTIHVICLVMVRFILFQEYLSVFCTASEGQLGYYGDMWSNC